MSGWSNTDTNLSKPNYVKYGDRNNNNANTYGVSILEMQQRANNKSYSNSAQHVGWVKIIPQYTDSSGNIRRKAETLVAISGGITGNANNIISGNVSVFTLNANVLGTNTLFTTELKVGDYIYVGPNSSNVRIVTSIASATRLTANAALASNGANLKVYVTDLGIFPLV